MATGIILLPLEMASAPSGGTGNAAAAPAVVDSSAGPGSNRPTVAQKIWAFDDTVDEHILWAFFMPPNIDSGGTLRVKFRMASATSGNVTLKAGYASTRDNLDDDRAMNFANAVTASIIVPATVGWTTEAELPISFGDADAKHVIFFGRDADDGADTATGDLILVAARYEYEIA